MTVSKKVLLLSTSICVFSTPAFGQDTPQSSPDSASSGIEQIIVTARRTSESLQDVPVSATAFSSTFLESHNVEQVSKIAEFTPNLIVNEQPGSVTAASFYIRGIGQGEPNSVAEAGVGVYLDGVYIARSGGALFDLVDLDRIEVLRGPQGTLFGRNTIGGAIQLISKKPTDRFGAEVDLSYGSFDAWSAKATVNTGEIGGAPIKAMLTYVHRANDGYINNILTPDSRDPGALNSDAVWVAVRGEFGKLTADYTFDFNERTGVPPFLQIVAASSRILNYFGRSEGLGGAPFQISSERLDDVAQAGFKDDDGRLRYDSHSKSFGHSVTLDYAVADSTSLKSISAYREFNRDGILPLSGNGVLKGVVFDPRSPTLTSIQTVPLYSGFTLQEQYQVSQELQLVGKAGDFSYLFGGYYFYEKADERFRQAVTIVTSPAQLGALGFPPAVSQGVIALNPGLDLLAVNAAPVQAFGGTSRSFATFGQVSWSPSSLDGRLEVTGGLRYTWDRKTIELRGDVNPSLQGRESYRKLSWLGSLKYEIIDNVTAYARASTGYKAGGFNPRGRQINAFEPESATAYEGGIKAEFFNRRLRVNAAAYLTDYDNLQVSQFTSGSGGASSVVVNAGKARIKGIELEVTAIPIEGLTLTGSLGLTDPKYKQFLYRDPVTNTLIDVSKDARFSQVSNSNLHLGASYTFPHLPFGKLTARADYSHQSKMYFDPLPQANPYAEEIVSPAHDTVSARLSLSQLMVGPSEATVSLWVENLTNDKSNAFGIGFGALGFAGNQFRKPRTAGVDVSLSF